jgi:hypothetical protein
MWMRAHDVRVRDVRLDLVGVLQEAGSPVVDHVRGVG